MDDSGFLGASATAAALVVAVGAAVIAVAGTRLARLADRLADLSGLGEASFGTLLLGGATALPGLVASVTAAARGYPELAVSNAMGGIAVQTAFLGLADLAYRKVNLEHAAASLENLMNGVLLIGLLAVVLVASSGPDVTAAGVHPASVVLLVAALAGLRMSARAARSPLWTPRHTAETRPDVPDRETLAHGHRGRAWAAFAGLAAVVGLAGYAVAEGSVAIAERTGLSETVVGALITAVATSLPELVTCVAAARGGAPTLAVAGIVGGNAFDVVFVAVADVAYRAGSIYHAVTSRQTYVVSVTILMMAVLLLGMLRRERRGIANIGFESFGVLVLYVAAVAILVAG